MRKDNNFVQAGKTIACGHCEPEKFGEGLKQALKVMPNYKCDCQCHQEVKEQEECKCENPLRNIKGVISTEFCPIHTLPPQEKAEEWWINEFDEEFALFFDEVNAWGTKQMVKSFIRNLLLKDREEVKKKMVRRQKLFDFIPEDEYGYKRVKTTDLNVINLLK